MRQREADARIGALQASTAALGSELATKATVQAVRECVTRRHYEQAVAALGSELERRAPQTSVNSLDSQLQVRGALNTYTGICVTLTLIATLYLLQALEKKMRAEGERVDVAVRFVDWFASRGEHYEHNMRIIDKHLKGLVIGCSGGGSGSGGGASTVGASSSSGGSGNRNTGSIGATACSADNFEAAANMADLFHPAAFASPSSAHSYFMPGSRVAFLPKPDHAR